MQFTKKYFHLIPSAFLLLNFSGAAIAAPTIVPDRSDAPSYRDPAMNFPVKRVLVRAPHHEVHIAPHDENSHYMSIPISSESQAEHDRLVEILKQHNVKIVYHNQPHANNIHSIAMNDPVLMTHKGAIILKSKETLRPSEAIAIDRALHKMHARVLYKLQNSAKAEAADMLWLDAKTLVIGRSFKTNNEGIRQIKNVLRKQGVQVLVVDLPYYQGPNHNLQLQSLIRLIDHKMAAVHRRHLPISFLEHLEDKGIRLIEIPEAEYSRRAPAILKVGPKTVLTVEGNSITKRELEKAGYKVLTYKRD